MAGVVGEGREGRPVDEPFKTPVESIESIAKASEGGEPSECGSTVDCERTAMTDRNNLVPG